MKSHITIPKSFLNRFKYKQQLFRINLTSLIIENITNRQSELFTSHNYYSDEIELIV